MSETGIESVLNEARVFDPPAALSAAARIGSLQAYRDLAARAEADPHAFWGEAARQELHWFKPFETVLDWSNPCLLYTSPSPRDQRGSRMPSSA